MQKDEIQKALDNIMQELKQIHEAFPQDREGLSDLSGHRRYHEAAIRAAKAQEDFWREMKMDLAKKGIAGLIIILIGLVVTGLMVKIGGIPK